MATALRYSDLEKLGVAGQLPRRIARTLLSPIYAGEASLQANLVLATSDDRPSMVSCYLAELLDGLGLVITTVVGDQACPLDGEPQRVR